MPSDSVDSIASDPPYELGFMGKKWDSTGIAYDDRRGKYQGQQGVTLPRSGE